MGRKRFGNINCGIGQALEVVGDWWSLMIVRDAVFGVRRFGDFEKSLGIAPNILSRRLAHLTETGLFERRRYSTRPPRHEYVLTAKGRDLFPVIAAILAFGNRHMAPQGETVLLAERATERPVAPIMVDAQSLMPLTLQNVALIAGPRATARTFERLAMLRRLRADASATKG